MQKAELDAILKQLGSDNDSDAAMALRGLQGIFAAEGTTLSAAICYAADHLDAFAKQGDKTIDHESADKAAEKKAPVTISGMPQCLEPQAGCIELIRPGVTSGEVVVLPGAAAEQSHAVAEGLKDALVAAAINKSRFKLKVIDVKNGRGEVTETLLQAVYDREGMAAITVWSNVKGEVAALATVLRKAVANNFPDLAA
jgi:hypothetical protein